MGADIHGFYIEQNLYEPSPSWSGSTSLEWWSFVALIDGDRDYDAFGVLAGVREDHDHIEPRGYPPVPTWSWQLRDHAERGGCHSATWLTTEEMIEAQERYVRVLGYYRQPYEGLKYAITVMRMAEATHPGKAVRAVFCFDS